MNKEEPYREQAERLKQRIQKINDLIDEREEKADLLPPREHLHREKKKKMKWKLKYPVIRLLVLFFILLPVIIFSVISYGNGNNTIRTVKPSGESVGYETINLEDSNKEENELPVDRQEQKNEIVDEIEEKNSEPQPEVPQPSTESGESAPEVNPSSGDVAAVNQSAGKGGQQPASSAASQPKPPAKTSKIVYHTVQPKETLFRIAMKYYSSQAGMDIIRNANNIQGDQIYAGQVLKIPLNN